MNDELHLDADMTIDHIFGNRLVAYRHAYESRFVRELLPDELPPAGAHVVTPWLGFAHHGIHVGEGKIVHYGALVYDIIRRPVEEVTLAEFARGRAVFLVSHAEAMLDPDEVVRRARSRIGENRYRLLSMNCEHFAEWCLHGEHRSFQVESALDFPRRAGEFWRAKIPGWCQAVRWTSSSLSWLRRMSAPNSAGDSGGLK